MPNDKKRKYPRVQTPVGKESMTKKSFAGECNINQIMAKFQKTGAINHYTKYAPSYGDATATELSDAMNIIANAETMFSELPSSIRKKFHNDPEEFLEFVQDPKNLEEMRELGLANPASPGQTTDAKQTQSDNAPASKDQETNAGDSGEGQET